ncbi:type II toxin-antitoxin system VapC family toxin [Pseudokineococcus sp. 5B2Z-1]|uniref:type II toxin-antitoxin system VapC family toxin n=1 Tax=Pseudokineococcus sp. 5B2Z-1 TaxID=3132744 RepID=UPI0026234B99|nr:type II toxin-antitoxin system VapC family toxin [uncultured Pseudokineococcus sp.]
MAVVLDASAAVHGLLGDGDARALMATEVLHVPHLADSEVASVLRRHVSAGRLAVDDGRRALVTWGRLGVTRHPAVGLLDRVWELRGNVTAYDATYVALAEELGGALVTGDARLGRAPGLRCDVLVVPG